MLEPRIQQHFFESADLCYQAAETLARPIAEAAQVVVDCITAGGRVFVHGRGASLAAASLFGGALSGRFERERPGLAACMLAGDAMLLSRPPSALGHEDAPAVQQLRVLGTPGDLLVAFAIRPDEPVLAELVDAAHEREMTVLLISGREHEPALGPIPHLIETDLCVPLPHDRAARVCELQLVILHALCDAVDLHLLGDTDF